ANWCCLCCGQMVECVGSGVLMEMGEKMAEKDINVPIKESKVYSNPLFDDDEINSDEIYSHRLNVESNFIESLSNHDTLKFDYLKEFSGALMPIRIAKEERVRREHAEYISLMESDSQREEIDIFTRTDELLPSSFENDDYDSEGEIYVLEEIVDNSISSSKNELSNFDDDPLFSRPPPKPPDVEFYFDFEPNSGEVILVVITIMMSLLKMNVLTQEERLMFLQMLKMKITFPSYLSLEFFYHISSILRIYPIMIEVSLVRFDCPGLTRASHPLFVISLGKSISLIIIV
nr:hypothetical protein [Tanacetum cinerariifolium]